MDLRGRVADEPALAGGAGGGGGGGGGGGATSASGIFIHAGGDHGDASMRMGSLDVCCAALMNGSI
jgi:hypothetical protein